MNNWGKYSKSFGLFFALTFFIGCGPPERKMSTSATRIGVPVVIASAKTRDVTFSTEKVGILRAHEEIEVNFSLPGNLGEFLVAENTIVEKDVPIARLDITPFKAKLREAELQLEELKRNRRRIERFYRKQMATQVEYDRIMTLYEQAKEQVNALKENLKKVVLRAPRRGLLTKRLVEPGNFVPPGVPVAKLVSLTPLITEFEFTDVERRFVPLGKTIDLTCESFPGKTFPGKVKDEIPRVDLISQLTKVEVELDNKDGSLKPGMMVKATIVTNRARRVVTVPIDTLVYEGDELSIFVYSRETSEAVRRKIKLGRFFARRVIVEEGIDPGEPVIVSGQGFVSDGTTVRLVDELISHSSEKE